MGGKPGDLGGGGNLEILGKTWRLHYEAHVGLYHCGGGERNITTEPLHMKCMYICLESI